MARTTIDRVTTVLARALILLLAFAPIPGFAQALQSPQELNPVQRAPAPEKPSGNRDLLSPPEPGPCPLASSSLNFKLTAVTFNGAAAVPPDELAKAYEGYLGRDVPVSVLCEIRDRASTILFNQGLFARVEIPAQRIAEGHVTLDVIEAYIASVRVQGDDSGAQSKVEDYIEMLRGMKPFNIKLAQRYLFLASDVPGVIITATLRPAGKGRGAIELVITVRHAKPVDAVANVQNFGSQTTGPWGALERVDLNGFTPFGERSTIVAYETLDIAKQRVIEAIEEARIGSDGLMGHISFSWGETHPGSTLLANHLFGQSYVVKPELSYPIVRMRSENLWVAGGLEAVDEKINSFGARLTQDRIRVFYLRANGDYSWRDVIPGKIWGNVELRQGAGILGASPVGDPFLSRNKANPDAFLVRGEGFLNADPFPWLSLTEHVAGQYTAVPLVSYEQQSIGNLTIGRGYDPSAVVGDRAVASATDLRLTPPVPKSWPVNGSVYGFFDTAHVWNLIKGGLNPSWTVRSVGAGVTVDILSKLHIETTYAHPMDKINKLVAKRAPDRILVSATVEY